MLQHHPACHAAAHQPTPPPRRRHRSALTPEQCAQCPAGQYACPLSTACVATPDAIPTCPGLKGTHFDASLTVEARLDYIFAQALTLPELLSQMIYNATQIPRLAIPAYVWLNDDQHGARGWAGAWRAAGGHCRAVCTCFTQCDSCPPSRCQGAGRDGFPQRRQHGRFLQPRRHGAGACTYAPAHAPFVPLLRVLHTRHGTQRV